MTMLPLPFEGAWERRPRVFADERGSFAEVFVQDGVAEMYGRPFPVAQVNMSTSQAGVVRGVHFSDTPPGQAKYVWCASGRAYDVVVDLRIGSPTFGAWHGCVLSAQDRNAVLIGEGLGHAFMALEAHTSVAYLCSTGYAPGRERTINAFDPELQITWPTPPAGGWILSHRDRIAPSLAEAKDVGFLPSWEEVGRLRDPHQPFAMPH